VRRTPAVVAVTLALAGAPLLPAASPALAASPTATVTFADTSLRLGEQTLVTITFSEPVVDFGTEDLTVTHGTIGVPSTSDNVTYTVPFTPSAGVEATGSVSVDSAGVTGAGSTPGTGVFAGDVAIDTRQPTATVAVADTELTAGETTTVTIAFSEAVTAFTTGDLVVANGTVSTLTSADGGLTWTATLTPSPGARDGGNVVSVTMGGVIDLAGNFGTGSPSSNSYAVDTVRPTATVVVADTALHRGETSLVTVTFNEAVSGFSNVDLTIADGTLSNVSSSDGGVTWTATFTPTLGTEATGDVIVLDLTGVQNGAGNAGAGVATSNAYAVDTLRPTGAVDVADDLLGSGATTTVAFRFSEPVTSFTASDVAVTGGTIDAPATSDGRTWTATLTPFTSPATTSARVQLFLGGVADLAGNVGTGDVTSAPVTVDNVAPTATLRLGAARVTGPTTLTVTLSEPVAGLTLADLAVTGGTLSALATADGGTTWTAIFTPEAGVSAAAATIRLDLPRITDLAGNPGAAAVLSAPFAIDTAASVPVPAAPVAPAAPAAPVAPVATPAPSAVAPAAAPARGLAATGAEVSMLLGTAAALVGAGLVALRARRARPRTR
jgi:hypothetical protein